MAAILVEKAMAREEMVVIEIAKETRLFLPLPAKLRMILVFRLAI